MAKDVSWGSKVTHPLVLGGPYSWSLGKQSDALDAIELIFTPFVSMAPRYSYICEACKQHRVLPAFACRIYNQLPFVVRTVRHRQTPDQAVCRDCLKLCNW